ncbi:MAG TPA: lysine--tRNA ligase [Spirochaetia bacterium]|nr:lysine--tRNA ligase [Spirochaetia bacterium]
MSEIGMQASHWADLNAERIIREKGEKDQYTCASGITPSGTVHIGNFREIISVDLVVRALRDRGRHVRFIYSWDDYDVFRKVPKNMPNQDQLEKYLRWPITLVPDPWGKQASYARANEVEIEAELSSVGIEPEYIYQTDRYRASMYAQGIRQALEKREAIREMLNRYRTEPLPDDWWPVSVFSSFTNTDNTTVLSWDGEFGLTYRCDDTGKEETVDLRTASGVKLFWRIDWPMRWAYESVDFEPAGKDHHSEGGSFDTARLICKDVYDTDAPVSFQYDFISIKGRGGKISSSTGEVISLPDVLEVYEPAIVRYLFAGTRPNSEFAISFDLDVIKIYEDYDRTERIYYGEEEVGEKRRAKEARIYELSQVRSVRKTMPFQVPFRHLCNLLQIADGNIERVLDGFGPLESEERDRLRVRARCAWNWITEFAPEDFKYTLRTAEDSPVTLDPAEKRAVQLLAAEILEKGDEHDEKSLGEAIYRIAGEAGVDAKQFFAAMYRVLIGKERGPRLAGFLLTVGRSRVLAILEQYRS